MGTKKQVAKEPASRQAAYTARNRSKLLISAQRVLAEIGPSATIEQISEIAEVSPTTVYKYFENKEILFSEAMAQAWREWVIWSYNGVPPGQSLEAFVNSSRKLFWIKQTHPQFAKILQNSLGNPSSIIAANRESGIHSFRMLAEAGEISNKDLEKRLLLAAWGLAGIMTAVHVTEEFSPTEAEAALAILMSSWGVSEAKIKKVMSQPLVFDSVK
jgi:AcrR family transcriptional regulator